MELAPGSVDLKIPKLRKAAILPVFGTSPDRRDGARRGDSKSAYPKRPDPFKSGGS